MSDRRKRRAADKIRGATTIIGEGMKFSGSFSGQGNLIVSGKMICDCDLEGSVTLDKTGRWEGSLRAGTVIIAGEVVGDVRSEGNIEISKSAYIKGSVIGGSIAVAQGAVIEGEMQTARDGGVTEFTEKRGLKKLL
ncbi:MAG: polymer-forming cytoskeletal protein [Pseudomonadota bacterium]